jgi:membrane-associated phospholipid phosphatase
MTREDTPSEPPAGLTGAPPARAPRGRPVLAAVLAVLLGAAAAVALQAALAGGGPGSVDAAVLDDTLDLRSPALTAAARVVTEVGNTATMALLAVLTGTWCWRRGRRADAVFVVVTMAGASALFTAMKGLLDRLRPPAGTRLADQTNESLPSGHATMSVVVLGSLVVLAWAGQRALARLATVAAAALWVATVGATRIYLGVHWFTDVVAGWLLSAAWLAACVAVWSTSSGAGARRSGSGQRQPLTAPARPSTTTSPARRRCRGASARRSAGTSRPPGGAR